MNVTLRIIVVFNKAARKNLYGFPFFRTILNLAPGDIINDEALPQGL